MIHAADRVDIRPESPSDHLAIEEVHLSAFGGPGEGRLVEALRKGGGLEISLVAEVDGRVVGHIAFSPARIMGESVTTTALALAPVAVLPDIQRKGVGTRLIQKGLMVARRRGWDLVIVLGHHHYYPRFGFVTAKPHRILCPFEVPDEAFMVLELQPETLCKHQGVVKYHAAFSVL
jgi:putative acetyltransferase